MKKAILLIILTFCLLQPGAQLFAQRVDVAEITLKKEFKEETLKSNKTFTVEKNLASLIIDVKGMVRSGKIKITLFPPNGIKPKIFEIDVTSTLEYHQTINLRKSSENIGDWEITIEADKADGSYVLNIRTSLI